MGKKQTSPAYVLGVGMTKFIKPRGKVDYHEMGFEAGVKAMLDAQITYDDVEQGVACYVYGDSTCGQRVFYQFGLTKIPIYNVNNNCSTGSSGLALARTMVSNGAADCVLVVGFEKMSPGSLQSYFNDRENPTGLFGMMMAETRGVTNAPGAAQMFGNAGREYMEKYIQVLIIHCKLRLTTFVLTIGTEPREKTLPKLRASTTNTRNATLTRSSRTNTHLSKFSKLP
jgi:sterol carrier protein 2